MRIMQITPGKSTPELIKIRQDYVNSFLWPGLTVDVVNVDGPVAVIDAATFRGVAPGMVERAKEAEKKKYDAVLVAGYIDPGLDAVKSATDLPVVAGAECTDHIACLLAEKFSIITLEDKYIPLMWRQARAYGVAERIFSIKAYNIPLMQFHHRKDELEERWLKVAREEVDKGAPLIVAGCFLTLPVLGPGSPQKLSKALGVPVLDANAISLGVLQMMVNLGLKNVRTAFPLGV